MNSKQAIARGRKIKDRALELRNHLWPKLNTDLLWIRTEKDGFTTIPRPMPQILHIMDYLAPKGKPVSLTYLSLWCRVFDECMVTIQNQNELAFEAGFTGQRAQSTWTLRMKILSDLGFIEAKEGASGKYHYVLILNPYLIIKKLYENKKIPDMMYTALFIRAQEVKADDLK